jgi:hypothetical protein
MDSSYNYFYRNKFRFRFVPAFSVDWWLIRHDLLIWEATHFQTCVPVTLRMEVVRSSFHMQTVTFRFKYSRFRDLNLRRLMIVLRFYKFNTSVIRQFQIVGNMNVKNPCFKTLKMVKLFYVYLVWILFKYFQPLIFSVYKEKENFLHHPECEISWDEDFVKSSSAFREFLFTFLGSRIVSLFYMFVSRSSKGSNFFSLSPNSYWLLK